MTEYYTYFSNLGLLELVGLLGFFVYITGFGAVQAGYMDGNGMVYSLVNVTAAAFVGISLMTEFNLSSALIQANWIVIGLTGVVLRVCKILQNPTARAYLPPLQESVL